MNILHVDFFLSQECTSGSLDEFDLVTLISKANLSATCYVEARQSFERRFSKSQLFIEGPFDDKPIETTNQYNRIKNLDAALNVMRLFGDLIQYMDISFTNITSENATLISQYIVDNCVNSLIELNLRDCYGSVLSGMQKPFKRVNSTVFSTHPTESFQFGSMRFNKLYPHLFRLKVNIANLSDWSIVGNEFPHLKLLTVAIPKPKYGKQPDLPSLMNSSRSINTLKLQYSSLEILQYASKMLSDLQILYINEFADDFYEGLPIEFENVINVQIISSVDNAQNPENLAFKNLQSLSLSLSFNMSDLWIQFFKNPNDQTLEFLEISTIAVQSNQLKQIAIYQPNLKWASIKCKQNVPAIEIVNFLENSKHIKLLELQCGTIDASELSILDGILQQNWHIENIDHSEGTHIQLIR